MQSLEIENFRGIRKGAIADLGRLNLLVGPNSSGKSTVLESLFLAQVVRLGEHAGHALSRIANRRGWIGESGIDALVPGGSGSLKLTAPGGERPITVKLLRSGTRVQVVAHRELGQFEISETTAGADLGALVEPSTSVLQPGVLDERFTALENQGRTKELMDLLRPLLPTISDLRILKPHDRYLLHVIDGTGRWPAAVAGDGLKRLLLLAGRFASLPPESAALLEEPEVHLHPRAIGQLAKLLWSAVDRHLQIVAATHSLELLDAIVEAAGDESAELRHMVVYRLALDRGELRTVRIPGPKVRELRQEIAEDLRR